MAGAWISASRATSVNRRPAYPLALSTCAAASRMRALVSTDFDSATSSSAGGAASFLLRLAIDRSYVRYSLLPGLHMVHPAGTTTLHSLYGEDFSLSTRPARRRRAVQAVLGRNLEERWPSCSVCRCHPRRSTRC